MITLQEYVDQILDEKYRQPLKTVRDACEAVGWEFNEHPTCCGQRAYQETAIIGACYVECLVCGRFIRDMSAPIFYNGYAQCIDHDKVDTRTDETWITGIAPHAQRGRAA